MQYTNLYRSPLGDITLAIDGEGLTGLWFNEQKYFAATLATEHEQGDLPLFAQTKRWLDTYFHGENPEFTPPLSPKGSAFRLAVWDILRAIPYGQVVSYGEIAKQLAARRGLETMSSQAVGGAVAHNPISIIVPCHRVVGTSGSLTGYAGGIEKKVQLLALEKANMDELYVPKKGTAL